MRNRAGLDYFIICFILSHFMKTQVTFSPTEVFVMCCNHGAVESACPMELRWCDLIFPPCAFKRKICLVKKTRRAVSAFSALSYFMDLFPKMDFQLQRDSTCMVPKMPTPSDR